MHQDTSTIDPAELRKFLEAAFSWTELKTLCHDLNVDYETFSDNKTTFALDLVYYHERRNQLPLLISRVKALRPIGLPHSKRETSRIANIGKFVVVVLMIFTSLVSSYFALRAIQSERRAESIAATATVYATLVQPFTATAPQAVRVDQQMAPELISASEITTTASTFSSNNPPSLILDGKTTTGWVTDLELEGAWIQMEFTSSIRITKWAIYINDIRAAARPKKVTMIFSDGTQQRFEVAGATIGWQQFEVKSSPTTSRIRIMIDTIYRGSFQNYIVVPEIEVYALR